MSRNKVLVSWKNVLHKVSSGGNFASCKEFREQVEMYLLTE